jgi:tetratricopeptide (TPR) repeat protein
MNYTLASVLVRGRCGANVNQPIKTFVAGGLLTLALFGSALAGALEDGQAAYKKSDFATAFQILRPLADQGNADAESSLGSMYDLGRGVARDYAEAVKWYRKAADQGNAHAESSLGSMYDLGRGVAQDYAEAVKWYRKAADQGNTDAQVNLGSMYYFGSGVSQDYAHLMPDGMVMVGYGRKKIPISVAQYRANGYRPPFDRLVREDKAGTPAAYEARVQDRSARPTLLWQIRLNGR